MNIISNIHWLYYVADDYPSADDSDEERTGNSVPNNQGAVADKKQSVLFDPWADEWYGSGPWWKKW